MPNSLKSLIKSVGIGITAVITHHYGSKLLDLKSDQEANKLEQAYQTKIDNIYNNTEIIIQNQERGNKASSLLQTCSDKYKQAKNSLDTEDFTNGDKLFKEGNDCLDAVLELIKPKNDFNFDLTSFYQYLDNLTLLEESALLHICFFSLILFTLLNILSTLFANELIQYFDLANKHPYIKKLLILRSKFQKYYFILNFSLIFIIIIVALSLNLIILI